MAENRFGRTSELQVKTVEKEGKTAIADLSFTAPYKIMNPFPLKNGGLSVMPLCASAGIMEGDTQKFTYAAAEGSILEVLSQSFDKIHRMKEGSASRQIFCTVEKNAALFYLPQPVIPYADSAFDSSMEIRLEDMSSKFFLSDILTCGRSAYNERFAYRRFSSRIRVYRGEKLIFRDNTCYIPSEMPMEQLGFYEGYTHMGTIFISNSADNLPQQILDILEQEEEGGEFSGGVTRLESGDFVVRMFGMRAQKLQQAAEKMKGLID